MLEKEYLLHSADERVNEAQNRTCLAQCLAHSKYSRNSGIMVLLLLEHHLPILFTFQKQTSTRNYARELARGNSFQLQFEEIQITTSKPHTPTF